MKTEPDFFGTKQMLGTKKQRGHASPVVQFPLLQWILGNLTGHGDETTGTQLEFPTENFADRKLFEQVTTCGAQQRCTSDLEQINGEATIFLYSAPRGANENQIWQR